MKNISDALRLYAVTDRGWLRGKTLFEQVEEAIQGGATMIQLREKELSCDEFLTEAIEMKKLCHRYGVPLIINDNVDIAISVRADGVHVGQSDMAAMDVRRLIGDDMILGVTAKTVSQALLAESSGADYLGSGAVFGSSTKNDAKFMTKELLSDICKSVKIPVVAIGGINRLNILELKGSGIKGAAIVSGIFAASDIKTECEELRKLLNEVVR